ncbi:MAG: VanZ family protein [Verrucomicrobiales bacterium]|nr:VanZ family protein [Verrucomicrobiales bacterium]
MRSPGSVPAHPFPPAVRILVRGATVAFVLFFIAVIVVADRGEGDRWWAFLMRIPGGDKLGHVGLVGMLSLLCNLAFPGRRRFRLPAGMSVTTAVLLTLLTLEEIAQAFLPHRTCDPGDWLADLVGLAAGQWMALQARQWFGGRSVGNSTPQSPG